MGHAPILLGAKLLRCIGLHAYPTGVATRSEGQPNKNYENQQQTITELNSKRGSVENESFTEPLKLFIFYFHTLLDVPDANPMRS